MITTLFTDKDYIIYQQSITDEKTKPANVTISIDNFLNYQNNEHLAFKPLDNTSIKPSPENIAFHRTLTYMAAKKIYDDIYLDYYNKNFDIGFRFLTVILSFLSIFSTIAETAFIEKIHKVTEKYFSPARQIHDKINITSSNHTQQYVFPFLSDKYTDQYVQSKEEVVPQVEENEYISSFHECIREKPPKLNLTFSLRGLDMNVGGRVADIILNSSRTTSPQA